MIVSDLSTVDEAVAQGRTVFIVSSRNGHDRLCWDAEDPQQVKDAIAKFDEYMKNGYMAFMVDADGTKGEVVTEASWRTKSVRQCEELLFERPRECRVMAPVAGG